MHLRLSLSVALAAVALAAPAHAVVKVIDFDDIVGTDIKLADGYGGVHWGGKFLAYDQAEGPVFTPHSGTGAAYFNYVNGGMTAGLLYTQSILFDADVIFNGAWFSGDQRSVELSFYQDGEWRGATTIYTNGVPAFASGYAGAIDEVRIRGGAGNFIMDDFAYDTEIPAAVPEPAAWALMLGGFGMIGSLARRSRRVALRFG